MSRCLMVSGGGVAWAVGGAVGFFGRSLVVGGMFLATVTFTTVMDDIDFASYDGRRSMPKPNANNRGVRLGKAIRNVVALSTGGRCVLGNALAITSKTALRVPTKAGVGTTGKFKGCVVMTRNNGVGTGKATSGPVVFATSGRRGTAAKC